MQPALCRVPGRYDARSLGGSSAQILGLFDVSVLARALEMVPLSICARVGRAARSVRVCVCVAWWLARAEAEISNAKSDPHTSVVGVV